MLTMNNIPSFILSSSHRTAPSATWEIFSFLIFCIKGSFNNYATLKLPFFDPPIPPPSGFITNDHKTHP